MRFGSPAEARFRPRPRSMRAAIAGGALVCAGIAGAALAAAAGTAVPLPLGVALAVAGGVAAAALLWASMRGGAEPVTPAPAAAEPPASGAEAPPISYRDVLELLPQPLVLVDRRGRVLLTNEAARRAFGGLATGRHMTSALRHPALVHAMERVIESGEAEQVDFAVRVPVERHFGATVAPLAGRAGEAGEDAPAAFVTCFDISAVRRVEQLRADFVANASHELRTPLASLAGFIETLQGPARDDAEARTQFLDIMAAQAARMRRLIDDLLSLSRIELNEHVPPSGTADLRRLLSEALDALRPVAVERRMTLALDLPEVPVFVPGDADQLTQVFQNLVDNALKYGRPDTPVVLRLAQGQPPAPAMIGIAIVDRGIGIPRDHIPRLTERFYRVNAAESRNRGGTGLGLAIVKHIVNRHGGVLDIESEPGEGSTFTVWLPLAAGSAAEDGNVVPLRARVS
ncbi:ATP-binding protein [Futiania mangrovi]|uniref:histidine kinase n=1 Tax=Futiania mangrovi TaxID=2959716 RepID=A0A9J6PEN2_9PROT|nr:ATP-binding protein [Futiania mangrovii]MCP1336235.1 ATP-binding protein [Futiania mangrovii]